MKAKIITYLLVLIVVNLQISQANAQQFTQIIEGVIVNTPSGSRSCNFLDFNNDNYQDILITNGTNGGENNMLYLNNGDGTFLLMSDDIVEDDTPTDGATCADYDNDSFIDVFAANWHNVDNLHYKNSNGNSFTQVDTSIVSNEFGYSETAAWGDFDNDGLVDLYVTNSGGLNTNFLYKNLGEGTFQPITSIDPVTDNFISRCVNWIDYDNDGDQDLFVTNESDQQNNLYRNDGGGVFTVINGDPVVSDNFSSMGSSWADYDNDGDFDLFVANYQQNNQMFNNDGSGNFSSVDGPWNDDVGCSFSSSFVDCDNDGDLDLYVTNGYCSNELNNYLYINNGDGTFSKDLTEPMSLVTGGSYGCAWGDYNNNGFMDLVVANWQNETQSNYLFRNNGNENNWFKLKLEGTNSNRSAIGAVVKCMTIVDGAQVWQTREVSSQTGYCSQNSLVVHFGLGNTTTIDSLIVNWPSGTQQSFYDMNVNQFYSLTENETFEVTGLADPIQIEKNINIYPNPSNGEFTIDLMDLQGKSGRLEIFDMHGKKLLSRQVDIDTNKMSLSLPDLDGAASNGTFTVNVILENGIRFSRKLMVNN